MSAERPTVSADLLAAMIESTPDRVRRRLDREPAAAAGWDWQFSGESWSIQAGGETVTLQQGHLVASDQLACSCLLAPRCFHLLACLTHLEVAIVETVAPDETEPATAEPLETEDDVITPDDQQQQAARQLASSLAHLLRVGAANAGTVVQSSLLRAVHQCRAAGLHRLAALGLRVAAGTSDFRMRVATSDPQQLAEDAADLLETVHHLQSAAPIAGFWIGTARRRQVPVRPRKLHGLFAEPIVTQSGFSGAAVYLLGEDDRIYAASDVRPGDAQHARDAYLGGIEIGALIHPARQIARSLYLGTELTASADGRLGQGKAIRIVEQGASTWHAAAIQERFRRPLPDQWSAIAAQAAVPVDARPAGWNFVFIEGAVAGAFGPELLFRTFRDSQPIRLAIENESETLFFRENLRMLSHAPGLRLQVIGRVNQQEPRVVFALAAAGAPAAAAAAGTAAPVANAEPVPARDDRPRLEIPDALAGRLCLGFDEIHRRYLVNAGAAPAVLSAERMPAEVDDPLAAFRRRWVATLLSGRGAQVSRSSTLASETAHLTRLGFVTAAALLDALHRSPTDGADAATDCLDTFLATAIYLRRCSDRLATQRAMTDH